MFTLIGKYFDGVEDTGIRASTEDNWYEISFSKREKPEAIN
jgi:hypothetical protein